MSNLLGSSTLSPLGTPSLLTPGVESSYRLGTPLGQQDFTQQFLATQQPILSQSTVTSSQPTLLSQQFTTATQPASNQSLLSTLQSSTLQSSVASQQSPTSQRSPNLRAAASARASLARRSLSPRRTPTAGRNGLSANGFATGAAMSPLAALSADFQTPSVANSLSASSYNSLSNPLSNSRPTESLDQLLEEFASLSPNRSPYPSANTTSPQLFTASVYPSPNSPPYPLGLSDNERSASSNGSTLLGQPSVDETNDANDNSLEGLLEQFDQTSSVMSARNAEGEILANSTTEQVNNDQAEAMRISLGTNQQLYGFFDKYAEHDSYTRKCYLAGQRFYQVLAPYPGLVKSEAYIRINALAGTKHIEIDNESGDEIGEIDEIYGSLEISPIKLDPEDFMEARDNANAAGERYIIIKFIVDISPDKNDYRGAVHCNLLYIDEKKRKIHRFEPLWDEVFSPIIDQRLKAFFAQNLPGYKFKTSKQHPQQARTETCPSKGHCLSFILKKAMIIINDLRDEDGKLLKYGEDKDVEELKILKFADAIEREYDPIEGDARLESGVVLGTQYNPYVYDPYNNYGYVYPPAVYPAPVPVAPVYVDNYSSGTGAGFLGGLALGSLVGGSTGYNRGYRGGYSGGYRGGYSGGGGGHYHGHSGGRSHHGPPDFMREAGTCPSSKSEMGQAPWGGNYEQEFVTPYGGRSEYGCGCTGSSSAKYGSRGQYGSYGYVSSSYPSGKYKKEKSYNPSPKKETDEYEYALGGASRTRQTFGPWDKKKKPAKGTDHNYSNNADDTDDMSNVMGGADQSQLAGTGRGWRKAYGPNSPNMSQQELALAPTPRRKGHVRNKFDFLPADEYQRQMAAMKMRGQYGDFKDSKLNPANWSRAGQVTGGAVAAGALGLAVGAPALGVLGLAALGGTAAGIAGHQHDKKEFAKYEQEQAAKNQSGQNSQYQQQQQYQARQQEQQRQYQQNQQQYDSGSDYDSDDGSYSFF